MKALNRLTAFVFALGIATLLMGVAYGLNEKLPGILRGGVSIGSVAVLTNESTNRITGSTSRCVDYQFPACATYGSGATTACHQHTPAFWLDGGQVGDSCNVTSKLTIADGGLLDDVTFDCAVVTPNRAIIRMHAVDTDAGVTAMGDAGFCVRTFSNQTQY